MDGHSIQAAHEKAALESDVLAIIEMLEEREWAEHCTTTPLGNRLESLITGLHNEAYEPTPECQAEAAPASVNNTWKWLLAALAMLVLLQTSNLVLRLFEAFWGK